MLKRIILVVLFTGIINFAYSEIDPSDPTDGGNRECPSFLWNGPLVHEFEVSPNCTVRVAYCWIQGNPDPEIFIHEIEAYGDCMMDLGGVTDGDGNVMPDIPWGDVYLDLIKTLYVDQETNGTFDIPICGEIGTHGGVLKVIVKQASCYSKGLRIEGEPPLQGLVYYWEVCENPYVEGKCYEYYEYCLRWDPTIGDHVVEYRTGPPYFNNVGCPQGCSPFCID